MPGATLTKNLETEGEYTLSSSNVTIIVLGSRSQDATTNLPRARNLPRGPSEKQNGVGTWETTGNRVHCTEPSRVFETPT